MTTVAAALIVRNEARVVRRCLDSVRGIADLAVVIDTGSTDGTLDVLAAVDSPDFPVRVGHRPWVGFGHNRTELLRHAAPHADYLLLIDADQTAEGVRPADLTADGYRLRTSAGSLSWDAPLLVRSSLPWRYVGVTHEYLTCDVPTRVEPFAGLTLTEHADSSRRQTGRKFVEDAALLEAEDARSPGDPRTVFYLARSYDDLATSRPADPQAAGWRSQACRRYAERAGMTAGYADEAWYSLFRLGVLGLADGTGLPHLLDAWQMRPHRWEPVHAACRHLNERGSYRASYALSRQALATGGRPEGLFVHTDVYGHGLEFEYAISAYYVGEFAESFEANAALLARPLPPHIDAAVRRNQAFPAARLAG